MTTTYWLRNKTIPEVPLTLPELEWAQVACDRRKTPPGRLHPTPAQVAIAARWLCHRTRLKHPNDRGCATGTFKHLAEQWHNTYLPEGAMIAAAQALGIPLRFMPGYPDRAWLGIRTRGLYDTPPPAPLLPEMLPTLAPARP